MNFLLERLRWKKEHAFTVLLLAAGIIALNCFGLFGQKFFRDFSIIFEGGYRIYKGQLPYRDFYLPVGPIALYLQALFFTLAGVSLWASALHAGTLAAILCVLFYLVSVDSIGKPLSLFLSISLFFSYTGLINYPWYNQTAYFFFLLNALLVLGNIDAKSPAQFLTFSAVLAVLGIFSKQDIGLLHLTGFGVYFLLTEGWKRTLQSYLLPAVILIAAAVALFQSWGNFLYWFNYGQKPSASRLGLFLQGKIVFSPALWALLVCALSYFKWHLTKKQKRRLFLLVLLIAVPFITSFTSGNPEQTRVQGIPIMLFLAQDLIRSRFENEWKRLGSKKIWAVHVLTVLILIQPVPAVAKYLLGNFFIGNDANQPVFIQKLLQKYDYWGMMKIPAGSYKGCVIHKGYNFFLEQIRGVLQKAGGDFFNMSEYEFLYADFKAEPPKGVPLWFDHGITYFTPDLAPLRDAILKRRARVILLQDPHTNELRQIKFYLFQQFANGGYKHLFTALAPAIAKIEVLVLE